MGDEKQNRALKLGAIALIVVGGTYGFFRLTRGSAIAEPTSSETMPPSASQQSSAGPRPSGSNEPPAPFASGRSRPDKPQVYPTAVSPQQKIGMPLRPMDLDIFTMIEKGDIADPKDVFPDKPYRVSMIRDHISGMVVVVVVDKNRNGKTDERWKVTATTVDRTVSAEDDGKFLVDYALRGGKWVIH